MLEGEIRGSVRLLTSDCGIADNDDTTLKLLQENQLPEPPDRRPFPNSNCDPLSLTVDDIRRGVMSFQPVSAAATTGLRPQHLKDFLGKGEDIDQFLRALTAFCNLLLFGDIPRDHCWCEFMRVSEERRWNPADRIRRCPPEIDRKMCS